MEKEDNKMEKQTIFCLISSQQLAELREKTLGVVKISLGVARTTPRVTTFNQWILGYNSFLCTLEALFRSILPFSAVLKSGDAKVKICKITECIHSTNPPSRKIDISYLYIKVENKNFVFPLQYDTE